MPHSSSTRVHRVSRARDMAEDEIDEAIHRVDARKSNRSAELDGTADLDRLTNALVVTVLSGRNSEHLHHLAPMLCRCEVWRCPTDHPCRRRRFRFLLGSAQRPHWLRSTSDCVTLPTRVVRWRHADRYGAIPSRAAREGLRRQEALVLRHTRANASRSPRAASPGQRRSA